MAETVGGIVPDCAEHPVSGDGHCAEQQSATATEHNESSIFAAGFGFFMVFPFKLVVFLALGQLPRSDLKGASSIGAVLIPWVWYAAIAHPLPVLLTYFISFLKFRTWRCRLMVLGAAAFATLIWYFVFGAQLLQRDYNGKF